MAKNKKEINRGNLIFIIIVFIVLLIMVGLIYFANNSVTTISNNTKKIVSEDNKTVSQSNIIKLEDVSLASIKKALSSKSASTPITPVTGESELTKNGLPRVLYVGADFCPFCAAERWALIIALSKFGTFNTLHYMTSSATDVYPSTPTFTFYKSQYTSKYIDFTPVETATNIPSSGGYKPLESLTNNENSIFNKLDSPPYVTQSSAGSIPFVDIGNKGLIVGAQYSPSHLKGLNWNSIINSIYSTNDNIVSIKILSSVGRLIQSICTLTNDKPQNVCSEI